MGLEMVEITMDVERDFNVTIPNNRISECNTYGDLLDLVNEVVAESKTVTTSLDVDNYLRNMLISEYSIKAEHIHREAELYGPELNLG